MRNIHILKQTESAPIYINQFNQLRMKMRMNDFFLQYIFYEELRNSVKDELFKLEKLQELIRYQTMAINIDNRIQDRNKKRTRD